MLRQYIVTMLQSPKEKKHGKETEVSGLVRLALFDHGSLQDLRPESDTRKHIYVPHTAKYVTQASPFSWAGTGVPLPAWSLTTLKGRR